MTIGMKSEKAIQMADNRVRKELDKLSTEKELSMAETAARLICNAEKRGLLSLLVAVSCDYPLEGSHPVHVPEETAIIVDEIYDEVELTKKVITSRVFVNAKEHNLLDRLLADPYDAEIEIEA
jgi:hypothetical protein